MAWAASITANKGSLLVEVFPEPGEDAAVPIEQAPQRVVLAQHDDIGVHYFASLPLERVTGSESGRVPRWEGRVTMEAQSYGRLLEIVDLSGDSGPLDLTADRLWLEPENGIGKAESGVAASDERARLDSLRRSLFEQPLGDDSAPGAKQFRAVILIDNIRLGSVARVPGILVIPLQNSTLGTDILSVLNDCLGQLEFQTVIDPRRWTWEYPRMRPAAVVDLPKIHASDPKSAMELASTTVREFLDILAVARQANPRILAGVIGSKGEDGYYVEGTWTATPRYSGNMLTGSFSGEDPRGLLAAWNGRAKDPRSRLWASLYANAIADDRWDYRMFRLFNLLEGVAREVIPKSTKVPDQSGHNGWELQANGKPWTAAQARGAVFLLIDKVAAQRTVATSSFTPMGNSSLWTETDLWVGVRNAVAHRGSWEPATGQAPDARWASWNGSLLALDNGQAIEQGARLVIQGMRAAAEMIMSASWNGQL